MLYPVASFVFFVPLNFEFSKNNKNIYWVTLWKYFNYPLIPNKFINIFSQLKCCNFNLKFPQFLFHAMSKIHSESKTWISNIFVLFYHLNHKQIFKEKLFPYSSIISSFKVSNFWQTLSKNVENIRTSKELSVFKPLNQECSF